MATPVSLGANTGASRSVSADIAKSNPATSGAAAVKDQDSASAVSVSAKAQSQLNASIVQASLTVSLKSANDPMSMVLKTALTGINEALKDDFGDNAIQNAAAQDNTPEATASRIVSLSTAFYEAYRQRNPGQDEESALNSFMETIGKGMEQGFKEARGILEGLKVLNGELAANIDKTYGLVQQGFADFAAARKAAMAEPAPTPTPTPVPQAGADKNVGNDKVNANGVKPVSDAPVNRYGIDPPAV
ncbi:MAG: DUF5610 domain-containing protein [Duganella sp.]